jgi:hypothetical protein
MLVERCRDEVMTPPLTGHSLDRSHAMSA